MNKLKGVDYNQLAFAEMMHEIKELKNLLLKYGYWNKLEKTYGIDYSNITAEELDSYLVSIGYVNLAKMILINKNE